MGRIRAPHTLGARVARCERRLVAGCAAGCGILQSLSSAVEVPAVADTNAHPLSLPPSKDTEDLEVRRSVTRSDRSARALRLPLIMTPKSPYMLNELAVLVAPRPPFNPDLPGMGKFWAAD